MILLNQYDLRWANVKMFPSGITLGKAGCTTTSICMLSDYFRCFKIPSQVIDVNIKYTQDGLIKWETINFPTFRFSGRFRQFDPSKIDQALKDPKQAVIFNVNGGTHWVAGVRALPMGFYQIYDPWGGKSRIINGRKNIVGFSTFQAK